jgi:hypothetical protein
MVRSSPLLSYVNVVTLAAVLPFGAGVVTVSKSPLLSYVFVVTFPSGSVVVNIPPKLLYVYDVTAFTPPPMDFETDNRLLSESYVFVVT